MTSGTKRLDSDTYYQTSNNYNYNPLQMTIFFYSTHPHYSAIQNKAIVWKFNYPPIWRK